MALLNPYINFNGNAEEAFLFYQSVFGGEFAMVMRFKDMPDERLTEADGNKIMHIALPIGKGNILMATDFLESLGQQMVEGNRHSLSLSAESKEEADRLYNALSVGGKITVPIADSPWGSYFGLFHDKYGIEWMLDYDPNYKGAV
jgi:PhnB protein